MTMMFHPSCISVSLVQVLAKVKCGFIFGLGLQSGVTSIDNR